LLTELGEEIENPGKTIPLALISGVVVVALVYLLFVSVLVGVMPWRQLGETEAAVAVASQQFLPWWGSAFVAAGAFFAVLTTVNTTLLVSSRTVMRAARDGILPERLSEIHPRFGTPYASVLLLGVPPFFLAAFIRTEVVGLSVFIALATLTAMFFSAIALWNLPVEFPEHYGNATLRLRRYRGLLFAVVSGMVVSTGIWVVTLIQLPLAGLFLVGWFGLGYAYYRYKMRKEGDSVGELYMRMVTLDEHEEAFAEEQTYDDVREETE
jgi:APA family basic amino acid/polyamine antiporter